MSRNKPSKKQLAEMARFTEYLLTYYPLTSAMAYAIANYVLCKFLLDITQ